ncbi:MAG TPA: hypothetical protein VFA60_16160 [Terriglobales bacterium]|nr:hypothetical protein [Terriglobales bacterium]
MSASSGQNPVTATGYNSGNQANGLVSGVTYGSNSADTDAYSYDSNTNRMSQFTFNVNGQQFTASLVWNTNGTLGSLNITDAFNANNKSCTYTHDALARIASVSCGTGGAQWQQTFTYDAFGNVSKSGSSSFQATYDDRLGGGGTGTTISVTVTANPTGFLPPGALEIIWLPAWRPVFSVCQSDDVRGRPCGPMIRRAPEQPPAPYQPTAQDYRDANGCLVKTAFKFGTSLIPLGNNIDPSDPIGSGIEVAKKGAEYLRSPDFVALTAGTLQLGGSAGQTVTTAGRTLGGFAGRFLAVAAGFYAAPKQLGIIRSRLMREIAESSKKGHGNSLSWLIPSVLLGVALFAISSYFSDVLPADATLMLVLTIGVFWSVLTGFRRRWRDWKFWNVIGVLAVLHGVVVWALRAWNASFTFALS